MSPVATATLWSDTWILQLSKQKKIAAYLLFACGVNLLATELSIGKLGSEKISASRQYGSKTFMKADTGEKKSEKK